MASLLDKNIKWCTVLWACEYCIKTDLHKSEHVLWCCGKSRRVAGWISDLQVWHIRALVLEMFSWCEHSVSFPPSLYLSSVGLTQQGLSPTQTTQLEMSNQWEQRKRKDPISVTDNHHDDWTNDRGESRASSSSSWFLENAVQWHVRQTGWGLDSTHTAHTHLWEVKPWSYSPRPQLYATSLHQFWKVLHWPTSSMRWRAAGIMSFSFPKRKKERKKRNASEKAVK